MSEGVKPKVLISAYGCEPERGSEAAVGWNWALQMSRYFQVYLVTRRSRQKAIESFLGDEQIENLKFIYVDFPDWVIRFKRGTLAMNLYYLAWQVLAFFKARRLIGDEGIELAHHVSFMSFTRGSYVPFLGVKSVLGPVGGLQTVPKAGRRLMRSRFSEAIRNAGVKFFRFNPIGAIPAHYADRIVLATGANAGSLPDAVREKTTIGLQVGTEAIPARVPPKSAEPIVLRWIGRMVDHKGFEILIDVLDLMKREAPDRFAKIRVVVSGSGPLSEKYHNLIKTKGLEESFEFLKWLSTEEMNDLWNQCHAFLFTSLRETTGLALLEAMTRGVPPIVIDNGGPSEIVSEDCGVKVSGENYEKLVANYCAALNDFVDDPDSLHVMGQKARERAVSTYSWDAVGLQMQEIYDGLLSSPSKPSA